MANDGNRQELKHVDYVPTINSRELYQIPEESQSESGQGYLNPNFSHSFNESFSSLPSLGRLTPVYSQGSVSSISSNCVLKRPDGSTILVTPDREARNIPSRPLEEKHIKYLKGFSIAAIILFPPLGVAAYTYALLTDREFKVAKQSGDMKKPKHNAKISERLIILSLICGIGMYSLIFGLVGRSIATSSDGTTDVRKGVP